MQIKLFEKGLHVKLTGDCALIAPPFIVDKSHIDDICEKLRDVLSSY
jgi:beta-alanine--pyruvate transaminase